jgi:pyridoxamine 5'-phosphate oxidase
MEFWHGRVDRMHDRFRYRREAAGGWAAAERLSP